MESQTDRGFIKSCHLCQKVYTQEITFNRHVKYCERTRSKQKLRPKSCLACITAKAKCSPAKPCVRCKTKGIACNYPSARLDPAPTTHTIPSSLNWDLPATLSDAADTEWLMAAPPDLLPVEYSSLAIDSSSVWQNPIPYQPDSNMLMMGIMETSPEAISSISISDLSGQITTPWASDSSGITCMIATSPEATTLSSLSDVEDDLEVAHTRALQQHGVTDDAVHKKMVQADFSRLAYQAPALRRTAKILVQKLHAFPQMMLRRQTFPGFIHPHWDKKALPEKLASCMGISQLFAARTSETRNLLWRMIQAEDQRFRNEYMNLPARELQMAVQSMIIYMIMAMVDTDDDTPRRGMQMLQTIEITSSRFREIANGYAKTERAEPTTTWEEWIFAESRRRVACLWVIISCVFFIDGEIPCGGCGPMSNLPLPSSKTLWEARTREEWQAEKAFYDASDPMMTLGELVEASKDPSNLLNAQKLHKWEAGSDQMAGMLSIATEFVFLRM